MQLFISQDINWWTGVLWCFYQLFGLSFWRHGFIGEQVMWCYISPNLFSWRNKLIYILDGLRIHFQLIFFFWVNYYLGNSKLSSHFKFNHIFWKWFPFISYVLQHFCSDSQVNHLIVLKWINHRMRTVQLLLFCKFKIMLDFPVNFWIRLNIV